MKTSIILLTLDINEAIVYLVQQLLKQITQQTNIMTDIKMKQTGKTQERKKLQQKNTYYNKLNKIHNVVTIKVAVKDINVRTNEVNNNTELCVRETLRNVVKELDHVQK